MWTKNYPSQLLLIRVKADSFRLTLPISLYIFEDLVDSIGDLLDLADYIVPHKGKIPFRPAMLADFCRKMVSELRSYGRWEMVEIEAANTKVYVGFY